MLSDKMRRSSNTQGLNEKPILRQELDRQYAEFLNSGGTVEQVPAKKPTKKKVSESH